MKLLLSSDGPIAIENLDKLVSDTKKIKIAWVITAAKTKENLNFLGNDLDHFLAKGYHPHIYDIDGKHPEDFEHDLADYNLIFIDGGNTFYLLKSMKESGFDNFLKKWVTSKPYIGVSAGSYVACPNIDMATWKHPDRDHHGLTDLQALSFVNFLLTVHYTDKYKQFVDIGKSQTNLPVKILRDGQALLIMDDNITPIGEKGEND